MNIDLEVAYLGVEVADPTAFGEFLANVVGLVPGEATRMAPPPGGTTSGSTACW